MVKMELHRSPDPEQADPVKVRACADRPIFFPERQTCFLDSFDTIRIINLPERTDRRQEMGAELEAIGLNGDPRVAFFDAIRPDSPGSFSSAGARGCFEGHCQILAEAADERQSVLILEDDCAFTPRTRTFSTGEPWDVFYGGYRAKDPHDLQNSDIQESHMMGFTARGARLVADFLQNLRFNGTHPPIDAAYVWFRRAFPQVATVFASPPLANQRPSASDIAPRPWDRFPLTRKVMSDLRKVRASLTGAS